MPTFSEIKTYISNIASNYGNFYSTNKTELGNLTQDTDISTILFLLDAPITTSNNEFTDGNRIIKSYNLTFYILKYAPDECTESQLDVIYSECDDLASQFFWKLNQGNTTIFNVDRMTTRRVKWITPNSFAGVQFVLPSVPTACNLPND